MARLSVVIPVYNESATVEELLRRVQSAVLPEGWEKEIIVVDDLSTDGTRDILREYESHVRVLYQEHNGGKGTAVARGLSEARGDYVVIQDADLEYDPAELGRLLEPIRAGEADVVYGSRTLRAHWRRNLLAACGVWALTKLANALWGLSLTDVCTCYKLFPARAAELWCPGGFESDIRITGALARRGYRFSEVPISYHPRSRAEGKKIRYRDGLRAIIVLVRDKLRHG